MDATTAAIDLITRFEGCRLAAYRDPGPRVPTIGYGTTVYPTGVQVRIGDKITKVEAREYLASDVAKFVRGLSKLLDDVAVTQNQFDALVSFSYNEGLGALAGSTLLRKLRAGDPAAAAQEFPKWNKATVNGHATVLPGLVTRRQAERTLFEQDQPAAGDVDTAVDTTVGPPAGDQPTRATLFDDAGVTVVALDGGTPAVTELLQLPDRSPSTLLTLIGQYPALTAIAPAPVGATVPAGDRQEFVVGPPPVPPVTDPPALDNDLLAFGSVDGPTLPGRDVHQLQRRLADLGYFDALASGTFDAATDQAVKDFQADYFGDDEADGLVGKKTWAKLFPPPTPPNPDGSTSGGSTPGVRYLHLTRTKTKVGRLVRLKLTYVRDGEPVGDLDVYSGLGSFQTFRIGKKSQAGSHEPLPEGRWRVGDMAWADGKDNYRGKIWNGGLGPVKVPLTFAGPGRTARGAIEIHIDWNRKKGQAGTDGCLGVQGRADFKILAGWLRETPELQDLYVDYGLGSCPDLP